MSLIDDIKRDREAGTPGPWRVVDDTEVYGPEFPDHHDTKLADWVHLSDTRRIARVPDMEAALLAAEELAEAVEAASVVLPANSAVSDVISALDAYRKATK